MFSSVTVLYVVVIFNWGRLPAFRWGCLLLMTSSCLPLRLSSFEIVFCSSCLPLWLYFYLFCFELGSFLVVISEAEVGYEDNLGLTNHDQETAYIVLQTDNQTAVSVESLSGLKPYLLENNICIFVLLEAENIWLRTFSNSTHLKICSPPVCCITFLITKLLTF